MYGVVRGSKNKLEILGCRMILSQYGMHVVSPSELIICSTTENARRVHVLTPGVSSLGLAFLDTFMLRGPWNVTALICPSGLYCLAEAAAKCLAAIKLAG